MFKFILIILITSGIFGRGMLINIFKADMSSKYAIVKSQNPVIHLKNNQIASRVYLIVGGIYFLIICFGLIFKKPVILDNYISIIISTFLIDLGLYVGLVNLLSKKN